MIFQNYNVNRKVIETPRICFPSNLKERPNGVYIHIPDQVRRELNINRYNQSQFRVIIVRK